MCGNVQFINRSSYIVLSLILTISFAQDRFKRRSTCATPSLAFVIAEIQIPDQQSKYCVGSWICTNMNKTLPTTKTSNTMCKHVLVSATCIKQEESDNVRVRMYYYYG